MKVVHIISSISREGGRICADIAREYEAKGWGE